MRHAPSWIAAVALLVSCASTPDGTQTPIPGTRVSLVVPEGFEVARRFRGVQGPGGNTITVTELPDAVDVVLAQMTEAKLLERGMQLRSTAELRIGGVARPLLEVTQEGPRGGTLRRSILLLGDASSTAVVVASAPAESADADLLNGCLLSASRDPDRVVGPFEGLGFEVEGTESLVVADRVLDVVSLRPPDAVGSAGEPQLIVAHSETGESFDLPAFSTRRLADTPALSRIAVLSTRFVEIDGLPGFEMIARALDRQTQTPLVVVQTIVADGDRYYLLQGRVAAHEADRYVPEFQQVAAGFRRTD